MPTTTRRTHRRRSAVITAACLALAVPGGAAAAKGSGTSAESARADRAARCARDLDRAERQYVRTTERRDADGFNALLDREVTLVLRQGEVYDGKAEFAAFIEEFFADPTWTQTFALRKKVVKGCSTAFVLYDSRFRDPDDGVDLQLVIGLSFVHRDGRWLVLHNQDSGRPLNSTGTA
jgi:ketosteroid isomerase-like protein